MAGVPVQFLYNKSLKMIICRCAQCVFHLCRARVRFKGIVGTPAINVDKVALVRYPINHFTLLTTVHDLELTTYGLIGDCSFLPTIENIDKLFLYFVYIYKIVNIDFFIL